MARITPAAGTLPTLEDLEDHEPYKASLTKIDKSKGDEKYGGDWRLQLDWSLDETTSLRDWISLRLGKQQNGQVSKLRALLNALSDKPEATEVSWFDDETFEWSYQGKDGAPDNKLVEGVEVVFRGKHGQKEDGSPKFSITTYQSPNKRSRRRATADEDGDGSEAPF